MLGTLISSVSNLASSYIEGKTAIQKAEATIRMKEATGEIDWDLGRYEGIPKLVERRMADFTFQYSSSTELHG